MGGRAFNTLSSPRAGPVPVDGGQTVVSNQIQAPDEVAASGGRLLIKDDVVRTLAMACEHLSVVGDPRFEVVEDPESQERCLAVHVNADGSPKEVFEQSEAFLDAFVANLAPSRQHLISLVYHSTPALLQRAILQLPIRSPEW